jgi:hypothetical protein
MQDAATFFERKVIGHRYPRTDIPFSLLPFGEKREPQLHPSPV